MSDILRLGRALDLALGLMSLLISLIGHLLSLVGADAGYLLGFVGGILCLNSVSVKV